MFEHWKGGTFIRIHHEGCKYSQSQRNIDPEAEQVMCLDGRYDTLKEAETAAQQKVPRWKSCLECCSTVERQQVE